MSVCLFVCLFHFFLVLMQYASLLSEGQYTTQLVVWHSGSIVGHIDEVTLRQAWLVL